MIVNDLYQSKVKYLYEGLDHHSLQTVMLWESVGQQIYEAQLTADQISQIFQYVEQGATSAGGNRTALGQTKDVAAAVGRAWEQLKGKVSDSGPVQGVDKLYDQAAAKLKQATGGDQSVMKYVQKYRDFAKKHPVAQSLIYAALIAAAGISGAGIGGAAALGLFKMVDKLLQGEKFSSAAYQGAKTGAMAYGASKLGDLIKGKPDAGTGVSSTSQGPDVDDKIAAARARVDAANAKLGIDGSSPNYDVTGTAGQGAGQPVDMGGTFASTAENPGVRRLANWAVKNFDQNTYDYVAKGTNVLVYDKAGNLVQSIASDPMMRKAGIYTGQQMLDVMKKSAGVYESINLSESQLYLMIGKIVERQRKLDEGIMDTVKGAAGIAVDWAKTKGANLTTKVTADKLMSAWKKAGSPMDSLDVASIIQRAGVSSNIIKQVYDGMNIPFAGQPGASPAIQRNISVASPQNTVDTGANAVTAAGDANVAAPAQKSKPSTAPTTEPTAVPSARSQGAQVQLPYYGINPDTQEPWTVDELQAKVGAKAAPSTGQSQSTTAAQTSTVSPTSKTASDTNTGATDAPSVLTPAQIRQQKQAAAAAVAQQQMKTSDATTASTTPAAEPGPAVEPTPAGIRQQKQAAAAAVAQQQMAAGSTLAPVGFNASNVMNLSGMPKTAGATTMFPSYGTAGQQSNYKPASVTASTTTALPKPTTTKISPAAPKAPVAPAAPNVSGTYNPRTGAAQMGGKSMVAFKDLPAAVQKKIDPTLAEQVKHMLESVKLKKDVEHIRKHIDSYFSQSALTENRQAQRRWLMDHVTKVSAIKRRLHAQSAHN